MCSRATCLTIVLVLCMTAVIHQLSFIYLIAHYLGGVSCYLPQLSAHRGGWGWVRCAEKITVPVPSPPALRGSSASGSPGFTVVKVLQDATNGTAAADDADDDYAAAAAAAAADDAVHRPLLTGAVATAAQMLDVVQDAIAD